MHHNEIPISRGLVADLLVEQFPQWGDLEIVAVESSGTQNSLYRLGQELVVRLPRLIEASGVRHEHDWLPQLAPYLPVEIPTLMGKGRPGNGYPCEWSVLRWIGGSTPTPADFAEPEILSRELAGLVSAFRRIPLLGGPPAYRGGTLRALDEQFRTALKLLTNDINTVQALAIWTEALAAPQWQGLPVWVHSDLIPGNLLISGNRLEAVIDFAASGMGDPASDLMVAWGLFERGPREVFRRALESDEATWIRGRGWALSQSVMALPYYRHSNPTMAKNAEFCLDQILGE